MNKKLKLHFLKKMMATIKLVLREITVGITRLNSPVDIAFLFFFLIVGKYIYIHTFIITQY